MSRGRMIALAVIVSLLSLGALTYWVLRPVVTQASEQLPEDFPDDGFDHSSFEAELIKYAQEDGTVDYDAWHKSPPSRAALKKYLAAVARYSPENAPDRFADKSDVVAYWMYAYNAMVIDAIVDRWPLESVTDVKAPIEVVRGLGFFYKLKFVAGGTTLSLYEIEHDKVIAQAQDPRVHFVLNCGSGGCPRIRPELPTGDALEPFLASSAADFVADDEKVHVNHDKRTVEVSKIFDWYEEDFLNELRRRGVPTTSGVLPYLALVAEGERKAELEQAQSYELVVRDYDWSVNKKEAP